MKTIWSGKFLDGNLLIACEDEPEKQHIIHYRVEAQDCAHWGVIDISGANEAGKNEREIMQEVLKTIQEQYLKYVMQVKDTMRKQHGAAIH